MSLTRERPQGAYNWLMNMGFIEWREGEPEPDPGAPGQALTPRGYACAAFADGHPLIQGTIVADGGLEHLRYAEVALHDTLKSLIKEPYERDLQRDR